MNGVAPPIGRRTPLNDASWKGHAEVVTLLLAHGADVHAKDDYYGYSLSMLRSVASVARRAAWFAVAVARSLEQCSALRRHSFHRSVCVVV